MGKHAYKLMQLNVNGLSENCTMALNRYLQTQNIDLLCLCETKVQNFPSQAFPGTNCFLKPNSNKARQRGVALLARPGIEITRHVELESSTADILVCIVKLNDQRIVLCSVYSPPNDLAALNAICQTIKSITKQTSKLNATWMLVLGDLNARHSNWGDHIRNNAGHIVDAMLTECPLSCVLMDTAI